MKTTIGFAIGLLLLFAVLVLPLRAQNEPEAAATQAPQAHAVIREKSLGLLRDIVPVSSSEREKKTAESAGGSVIWGNLFDPHEVVALVNLAAEEPRVDADADPDAYIDRDTWVRHLSLCAWENDHWIFRQYLDNARSPEFHTRKDKPSHFVQASRWTGRHEGDHLSWYYDPATRKLVRTHFETWGPFYLVGDYLCTERGIERRAIDVTTWVYPYKDGKKGDLLAISDSDAGRGELRTFAITFRDRKTGKYWTYAFEPKESEPPYLHYTVDAVEGKENNRYDQEGKLVHRRAEMELSEEQGSIDEYFFERLTGLSRAVLGSLESGAEAKWHDALPKLAPLEPIPFKISGDPDVVRRLQKK